MAPDEPTGRPYATTQPGGTATVNQDTIVPRRDSHPVVLPDAGYTFGDVIGRGGMGEVVSARDLRIGRDVAIKRMRGDTPSDAAVTRFLREARIQARLDHPAIVPVHELGVDADGRPYFTMKRLAGVTLAQRMTEQMSLKPLLRAFVDVCLAIEFAHTRKVVHRDLKPANIMLGDYGEVYVLDWGIARVLDGPRPPSEGGGIDTLDEATQAGDLLGTPGYMAPEQVRGADVGPAADVYALGAILFEILAGEPLHPRGTAALAMTLATPQASPAERAPARDIAPELDAACVTALADDGTRPTARELGELVQRYLDGDRDHERRRALALDQLAVARAAYESKDPEQRPTAIRSAGRALALDQESVEAAQLVTAMLVEPPRELPAALVSDLAEEDRRHSLARLRLAIMTVLGFMSILALVPWMEVSNWTTFGVSVGVIAASLVSLLITALRKRPSAIVNLATGFAITLAFTRILGPFVLTPAVIAGSVLAASANPRLLKRPILVGGWALTAMLLPIGLESIGVFHRTWAMVPGGVCSTSAMFDGTSSVDGVMLVIANSILLVAMTIYAIKVNRTSAAARHDLHVQAWQLKQLISG